MLFYSFHLNLAYQGILAWWITWTIANGPLRGLGWGHPRGCPHLTIFSSGRKGTRNLVTRCLRYGCWCQRIWLVTLFGKLLHMFSKCFWTCLPFNLFAGAHPKRFSCLIPFLRRCSCCWSWVHGRAQAQWKGIQFEFHILLRVSFFMGFICKNITWGRACWIVKWNVFSQTSLTVWTFLDSNSKWTQSKRHSYACAFFKAALGSDLKKEMMRVADDAGNERAGYGGSTCGKTPTLETPPPSLSKVEKALDSMMTPPPVGVQTVPCQLVSVLCSVWFGLTNPCLISSTEHFSGTSWELYLWRKLRSPCVMCKSMQRKNCLTT